MKAVKIEAQAMHRAVDKQKYCLVALCLLLCLQYERHFDATIYFAQILRLNECGVQVRPLLLPGLF